MPDEKNGYRYYTYRDFGRLIYARNLRAMGFSVEEAGEYLDADFSSMGSLLEERKQANCEEIARIERANRMLSVREKSLAEALAEAGTWREAPMPPLRFVGHFHEDRINESMRAVEDAEQWRELYEHADIALRITGNLAGVSSVSAEEGKVASKDIVAVEWGLCRVEDEPSVDISQADVPCLVGSLIIERTEDVGRKLASYIGEELRSRSLAAGAALCVQRAVHRGADGIHVLFSLYVPLGRKTSGQEVPKKLSETS